MNAENKPSGLVAIDREMARQHADALASLAENRPQAKALSEAIGRTNREESVSSLFE